MNILLRFLIKRHTTISFDIFDTLIERDVDKPDDIFYKVGIEIFHDADKAESFRRARIQAEKISRQKQNGEVTLEQIYKELDDIYRDYSQALQEEEENQEVCSCYQKEKMKDAFEYAKASGKTVILISDMYLPKKTIVAMLDKCNVTGYDYCYVSNEYGVNKISGKLFDLVVSEMMIKKTQLLHVGDSIKADFLGPIKSGICPFLIGRKNRLMRFIHK